MQVIINGQPVQVVINRDAMRLLRRERGLQQLDLANAAQVSKQLVNDLERGRRLGTDPALRRKLADALGVRVEVIEMLPAVAA